MNALKGLVDFILHLDRHLSGIISTYGVWTYGILFLIVFCETGLVILPLLPGDSRSSLLPGALPPSARSTPWILFGGLAAAAIIRDNVNSTGSGGRLARGPSAGTSDSSSWNTWNGPGRSLPGTGPGPSCSPDSSRSSGRSPHSSPG